jgi:hypothetical protein
VGGGAGRFELRLLFLAMVDLAGRFTGDFLVRAFVGEVLSGRNGAFIVS